MDFIFNETRREVNTMAMKEGIFLHNTHHVQTDSFGAYSEQSPVVGFTNYGDEGKLYYSFDELEDLLKNGFIDDNITRNEEGRLYLKGSYCSYSSSFRIVCGQVLSKIDEKRKGIFDYCKKIGLIKDDFAPVVGWFGTKEMTANKDNTFNIYYTFNNFNEKRLNMELAESICIGKIKKLSGQRVHCYSGKNDLKITPKFQCKSIEFDKENKKLIIRNIPLEYITGSIVEVIVNLDLELWMLFNDNKHWDRFFNVAIDIVRDMGQTHWFNNLKYVDMKEDKERNLNWHKRQLGEEWNTN